MKTNYSISAELKAIIPKFQLLIIMDVLEERIEALERLESQLKKCPKIGETDSLVEHPAIFHYFHNFSDFYICEYDPKDGRMFGYSILCGDLPNSEWGYFSAREFGQSRLISIDYHLEEQSIEAALYKSYPDYFKRPLSLNETPVGKNDPLPETYQNYPYQYKKEKHGVVLSKKNKEVFFYGDKEMFLSGDNETIFFRDCNRAKQHNRSISEVIKDYFFN